MLKKLISGKYWRNPNLRLFFADYDTYHLGLKFEVGTNNLNPYNLSERPWFDSGQGYKIEGCFA